MGAQILVDSVSAFVLTDKTMRLSFLGANSQRSAAKLTIAPGK